MNKGIIFGPPYDELEWNKWERYSDDPEKLILMFPNHEAKNLFKVWEAGFLFYRDSRWNKNLKDDGEYVWLGDVLVDDEDDFYGGEFMIGDTWEGD